METETAPNPQPVRPVYDGSLGELYAIYLRHLVLMVLTLGWSRFWGRTRLRRYLWNHFSVLGDRFEYRGRGLELFIGFVLVLLIVAAIAGTLWLIWAYGLGGHSPLGIGPLDALPLVIALIGFPLAFVGHFPQQHGMAAGAEFAGGEAGGVGLDKLGEDLVQRQGAGIHDLGVRRALREKVFGHDRARVQTHRASLQEPLTAHGDQVGGTRAGADEVDRHRLVTDHCVTGYWGRQPVKPPSGSPW